MAAEKKNDDSPEQCWKDLVKHNNNPINYFILNLDGKTISVASKGTGSGIEEITNEASAGSLIYLRVNEEETGAYDATPIKPKYVRIQINPDQCKPVKLIEYRNFANSYNNNKNVHFEQTIKNAEIDDVTLEWIVTRGKFDKSAHKKGAVFKFGKDEVKAK